jgi:DNA-directed RNA polymerase alpha subunit
MKSKDILTQKIFEFHLIIRLILVFLNLSLRSYTGLKRLKINRIEDLIQLSKQDIIDCQSSSEKTKFQIK